MASFNTKFRPKHQQHYYVKDNLTSKRKSKVQTSKCELSKVSKLKFKALNGSLVKSVGFMVDLKMNKNLT